MFNSGQWNRDRSPLTDQCKSFLRDIKPRKDVCLSVEYTVLSLPFVFFCGFLCASCWKWSLYLFFSLSNTALLLFPPVLIYYVIALTLLVARSAHLLPLLWIGLVFIAMNPSSLAAVTCLISFFTSGQNKNEQLGRACSCRLCRARTLIAALAFLFYYFVALSLPWTSLFLISHSSIIICTQVSTIDAPQI